MTRPQKALIFVTFVIVSPTLQARIVDAEVVPPQLTAGQEVLVRIDYDLRCPVPTVNPDGETHDVTVAGDEVILDVIVGEICITPPPGIFESNLSLGNLPPGDYTLVINQVSSLQPFPASPEDRSFFTELPLAVGSPITIPTTGWTGILALALIFAVSGTTIIRRM